MRILQVCPKYYPSLGGVEEHVRNISERLAQDHEVTVFTCDPTGKLPRSEEINKVKISRFKSFSPNDSYHLSREMLHALKSTEFEIVNGHSYHAFPLLLCRYAKADKFIITSYYHGHGSTSFRDLLFRLYKVVGKKVFEQADGIIALSNHEKELLRKDFNIQREKISVIPSGIKLSEFKDIRKTGRDSNTILCVGRLEKYKGVQYIIQALPMVNSEINLNIVGKGPFNPHLESLVEKLGLEDRVHFHQDVPRKELINMYSDAGLLTLLSKYESFSIVVAEALAARTPCIVANTSALSEWIDQKNCYGIDYPVNTKRLAELIETVIGTEVKEVKLWDWDDVAQETLRVYQG